MPRHSPLTPISSTHSVLRALGASAATAAGEAPGWFRYSIAVVIVALATIIRVVLYDQGATGVHYVTFYPAIILVALFLGTGPALFAIALSTLASDYYSIPPVGSLLISAPGDRVGMGFFVGSALLMAWVCAGQRSAIRRAGNAEDKLFDAHERAITALLENISDGVVVLDRDWRYVYVNSAAANVLRMTREQLLGKTMHEVFPDVDRRLAGKEYRRSMEENVGVKFEDFYPAPLNAWFEVRCYPSTAGLSIFFTDVSERKTAEIHLRKLSRAVERSPAAIVITDRAGAIEYVNPKFTTISGYTLDEARGKNPRILKSGMLSDTIYKELWETISAGQEWRGQFHNKKKNGELFWEAASISPITDDKGAITHFVSVKEDITERVWAEQIRVANMRLEDQNRRMQQAEQVRREFLANMSHELRTPLNGVIGFAEVLIDGKAGPLNEKQSEYLRDIHTSGRHLLQLINGILDLAKVEAGKMELYVESFSLPRVITDACAVVDAMARKHQVTVEATVAPDLDTVELDEQRLKQVLYNLLSNAVKFTNPGGRVRITAEPLDQTSIRIQVIDSGIGIRKEDFSRLFKEFQQLDSGMARRYGGSGLGLALTRRLVELQHGAVSVESEVGKGSTFTVDLPLGRR